MGRGLGRKAWAVALAAAVGLPGCVERRFVINSDPPGAVVYVNGRPLGAAPADDHFVYYGNYHFTLVANGYQTLQVDQCVSPPWYEYPGLDFIAEVLVPWQIRDVRRFTFALEPMQVPNTRQLLDQAQGLRGRGQLLQPLPSEPASPPPPTPALGPPVPPSP
jgi:hypothetical protein